MRFCPYCSAENADDSAECQRCARRFLPLPPPPRVTGVSGAVGPGSGAGSGSSGSGPGGGPGPGPGMGAPPGMGAGPGMGPGSGFAAGPGSGFAPGMGAGPGSGSNTVGLGAGVGSSHGPDGGPRTGMIVPPPRARRTAPLPSPTTGPIRSLDADDPLHADGTPAADDRDQETELDTELQAEPGPDSFAPAMREPTLAPPPTRQVPPGPGGGSLAALPTVAPLPESPESGFLPAARYAIAFGRGLWRRRVAVRNLNDQIRTDTIALDAVLGALGRAVRQLRLNNRSLAGENQAIDDAEGRRTQAEHDSDELIRRLEEENQRFAEQELDRENKLAETEVALRDADKELDALEAQRRSLRDKRKSIERQQRAYLKTADDREADAAKAPIEDDRSQLRGAAEDLRREAAERDPERQDLERRLTALEKPVSQAAARVEALRGEQESLRRALHDLREGHRHRLSEIEAEQGRKGRDFSTAESEIGRRMITLGTLLNLNRVERPEFDELYARVDQLRNAIGARSQEIDRLVAERGAYDRGALVRGVAVVVLALVLLTTAVVLVAALL